ncbi:Rv0361 family membrane protein [Nocardia brasiliensis]|uniref:Rv0361 family membrane protein n=1 Tax=Nocardia brasiliensis TaxID=37326 RepID=UPI003D91B5A2
MQQPGPPADAGAEDETVRMQTASTAKDGGQNPPASEDVTVAMPVIKPDDAKTVALPVQRPDAPKQAGTDRVAPGPGRVPISKPPSTPRPAAGPKQPGPQGPSAPPQSGPGLIEDARPAPPQQRPGSAPSPADIQPTLPAQSLAGPRPPQPRPIAQPQRITPAGQPPAAPESTPQAGRSKRWLLAVAGAAVLVVVLIGVAVVLITGSGGNSAEEKVRAAITDYTQALKKGDLNALRSTTCGPLHDFYQGIPADQFAGVHQLSMDRRNIPVIDGIDAIRITDKTAIAQATVYTEADPAKRSARTFDLQDTDGGWKVCDPPTSPQ